MARIEVTQRYTDNIVIITEWMKNDFFGILKAKAPSEIATVLRVSDVKVKKDDLGNVTAWIEIDDLIVAKVMEKEAL